VQGKKQDPRPNGEDLLLVPKKDKLKKSHCKKGPRKKKSGHGGQTRKKQTCWHWGGGRPFQKIGGGGEKTRNWKRGPSGDLKQRSV